VQLVTVADLKLFVWRNVGIRRHLVGRQVIDDFTELAVQHWESEAYTHAVSGDQQAIVTEEVLKSVKRGYQIVSDKEPQEYGFFWALVLQAVASIVVQLILRWWLDARINRVRILIWQQELTR
jgi:hypothetical protein